MRTFRVAAFAVALCLIAGSAQGASTVSILFGNRVVENARFKAPFATLDLGGDGGADRLYLVSIAAGSQKAAIAPDVTIVPDVFDSSPHPLGNRPEWLALGIVFGKSGRKFLITDMDENSIHFFSSDSHSIWAASPVPLSVAKRGSAQFAGFHKQEKRIRNDVIVLGTEAGIDMALYWNGRNFVVFAPPDD